MSKQFDVAHSRMHPLCSSYASLSARALVNELGASTACLPARAALASAVRQKFFAPLIGHDLARFALADQRENRQPIRPFAPCVIEKIARNDAFSNFEIRNVRSEGGAA